MYSRVLQKTVVWTKAFLKPVTKHPELFLFSILMSNVICYMGLAKGVWLNPFLSFLFPIFDSYVFCLAAFLLKKVKLHFLVWIILIALLFGELFTVCYYHSAFSIYVVRLILQTNTNESRELLYSVYSLWDFWQAVLLTVLTAAASVTIPKIKIRSRNIQNGILAVTSILIIWSSTRQIPAYVKLAKCYLSHDIGYCADEKHFPQLYCPTVRFVYGCIWNITETRELKGLVTSVEYISPDSCSFKCPLIILIIGESYNKYHCQLYQEDYLPTTPNMMTRFEKKRLIPLHDVVSSYNVTSEVFKGIFSTWDSDDTDDWAQHTLFTALFKKAGYQVHFLTNQFVSTSNYMWDSFGGGIFNFRELSNEQFTSRNTDKYEFDGELLNEIPVLDSLTSHPTLLIVHLIGQHVEYSSRYPSEFAKFTPATSRAEFGGDKGKQISAAYDNAVFYNDWVVEQIMERFDSTDAIGLYFADHGEEAFDWRDKNERSQEDVITPEIARYQYEIPMMFFVNDTFRVHHPDIVQQIYAGADKPLFSPDISNIMLYLGGISTKEYKDHRNILSPNYQPRKRLLRGKDDYDEIISSGSTPCTD